MNKKIIFAVLSTILVLIGLVVWDSKKASVKTQVLEERGSNQSVSQNSSSPNPSPEPADKIVVVHFHGTHQCWSCITVGEYALKTIKEKFPEEYASGKIVYKDINGELKENQEIVAKYHTRGSSLFINAVRNGEDNISEDVKVWRLVNNEAQFIDYFEDRLRSLLGK